MPIVAGANAKRLALLLWVLVAFFYFYLSYDYVRVTMNDRQFADYLQYVVQIAGNEQRPAKEIRALLLVKAEELALPVTGEQITILGGGDSLNVGVNYDVDIEIPLLQRQIYTKHFEHKSNTSGSSPVYFSPTASAVSLYARYKVSNSARPFFRIGLEVRQIRRVQHQVDALSEGLHRIQRLERRADEANERIAAL